MATTRFSNSRIGTGFPKYQTFTAGALFPLTVEYLVIAGGGSGGKGESSDGAGGGP